MLQKILRIAVLLLLLSAAVAEDELLDPDVAFRFSARMISDSALEVRFAIADGYYMYRDAYRFSIEPEAIELGEPQFPSGLIYEDEFFGRSEIYRKEVTIRLPIRSEPGRQSIRLVTKSQGCADVGVCYLPATHVAEFSSLGLPGLPVSNR